MADETATARSPSHKAEEAIATKNTTAPESASAADAVKDTEMKDTEEKPKNVEKTEKESAAKDSGSKAVEADAKENADVAAKPDSNGEKSTENEAESKAEDDTAAPADESTAGADTVPKGRRKSTAADNKAKSLKKKASKAKILNLDAKPGDHFFAKLKGFPPWPVVICAEDMLPQNMLSSRPVTAAREDGTYRDDFADGGKRAADRTFPVMYLYTNEFSWTPNTDLSELDPETVADMVTSKMRKDLQKAHELAAENNDLQYYRDLLLKFEEEREQARLEKEEKAKAKAVAAAEKKAKSSVKPAKTPKKSKASVDDDGDMDMVDIGDDDVPKSKTKKRKAEDVNETPQRSDSVKKPKIKLTTSLTPKANGVASPKDSSSKTLKVKAKPKKAEAPKEPELSPEEKKERKQKEILFLRHRLQKGLLNRTAPPQEDEMKSMSEFLGKLETFPDLEADIIKATKINKVLKAMLKLDSIPKDEEFKFTPRSKALLDKWTKILNAAEASTPAPASSTNGVNGEAKATSNGVKEASADATDKPDTDASASKATATEDGAKTTESEKEVEKDAKAGEEIKSTPNAATAIESAA